MVILALLLLIRSQAGFQTMMALVSETQAEQNHFWRKLLQEKTYSVILRKFILLLFHQREPMNVCTVVQNKFTMA